MKQRELRIFISGSLNDNKGHLSISCYCPLCNYEKDYISCDKYIWFEENDLSKKQIIEYINILQNLNLSILNNFNKNKNIRNLAKIKINTIGIPVRIHVSEYIKREI